ncbi:hypothetical protein ABK040_007491 [Willaertia magna]
MLNDNAPVSASLNIDEIKEFSDDTQQFFKGDFGNGCYAKLVLYTKNSTFLSVSHDYSNDINNSDYNWDYLFAAYGNYEINKETNEINLNPICFTYNNLLSGQKSTDWEGDLESIGLLPFSFGIDSNGNGKAYYYSYYHGSTIIRSVKKL